MFNLDGRVAVVVGAGGLLGPGYCEVLAKAGAKIVAADIRESECQAVADGLDGAIAVPMDITDPASIDSMVKQVVDQHGKIDILVNCVAYNPVSAEAHAPFEEYSSDVWNKVIDVNLTGVMLSCQSVGRQMLEQGGGVIMNMASIYGMVGADQRIYGDSGLNSPASYAASKGGIISLTMYLAAYWEGKNIRINCMSPGGVQSPTVGEQGRQNQEFLEKYTYRNMLHRMARKEDLWGGLLYLCSDASAFVTGSNLVIDAGWTAW
jgi:NAD(P)-dependent dehydrogenase (short-subunit alcohol dehydrogenase family)